MIDLRFNFEVELTNDCCFLKFHSLLIHVWNRNRDDRIIWFEVFIFIWWQFIDFRSFVDHRLFFRKKSYIVFFLNNLLSSWVRLFFDKEHQNICTIFSQFTYQSAITSQQSHLNFIYLVKIVEQNKHIERCKNNRNRFEIVAVLRFWRLWIVLIFDLYWIF